MKRILSLVFCLSAISAVAQSDLVVGPNFKMNIQRQDNDADAFILHNAKVDATPGLNFRWDTSHPSFGTRGIYFGYLDGIKFFADNASTTGGASFSPTTRMFIGNSGSVGIGTTSPGAYSRLNVVGGAVEISNAAHNADASLHISTSYGQFDRLTQINPSLDNKPALNLMASRGGPGVYNWWSWGVLTSGAWALQPSTSFGGSTGLFINPNGNTGIGTINPTQKLEVNGSILQNAENTAFGVDNIGDSRLGFLKKAGYVPVIASSSGSSIIFSQTNQTGIYSNIAGATLTERMRVDANGTVGINTATPSAAYKLDVNGVINTTGLYVNGAPFSSGGSAWLLNGASMYYNSGSIGIGTSTPSATYKLDVNGIINATGLYVNGQPFAAGSSAWQLSGSNLHYTSGNVGIGVSPSAKLTVHNDAPLATTAGSNQLLMRVSGRGDNNFMNNLWLRRDANGFEWWTTTLHDGISIDGSFLTPGVDTRTWWERHPQADKQMWGHGTQTYMTLHAGNLGIGTPSPVSKVQINASSDASNALRLEVGAFSMGGSAQFQIDAVGTAAGRLVVKSNGYVGIGTANPDAKLAVKGTVHANEVKVDLLGAVAPDYVFDKDYNLPTLESIKTYIDQNKHLPEVPSAAAMEANGINLGEMNMLLLKKIEELTLYVIGQQKEIEKLKEATKSK